MLLLAKLYFLFKNARKQVHNQQLDNALQKYSSGGLNKSHIKYDKMYKIYYISNTRSI